MIEPTWQTDDGRVQLYCGDCLEILPHLDKVDAVLTSPPYGYQRDYGNKISDWDSLVPRALRSVQCGPNAQVLVNLGLIHRDGCVWRYWDALIREMETEGYRLFGWYCWDQGDGLPGNWNGRLAPSHEFIFHFNRQPTTVNKWVRVKNQRGPSGNGLRNKNGTMSGLSSPDKCGQPFKVPDSVIRVYREMRRDVNHPAVFPVGLPLHLINSFTICNNIVIDPFMGSGTTGVAAVQLGRKFIGIEIDPGYFDIAKKRIIAALGQTVPLEAKDAPLFAEADHA